MIWFAQRLIQIFIQKKNTITNNLPKTNTKITFILEESSKLNILKAHIHIKNRQIRQKWDFQHERDGNERDDRF